MEVLKTVLTIVQVIASVALVLVVLLQSGKEAGLGAITGNNESYMNKSGAATLDKKLAAATKWVSLAWILLTLGVCLL